MLHKEFLLITERCPNNKMGGVIENLRTVPTVVIAHTFCATPDTRISYR